MEVKQLQDSTLKAMLNSPIRHTPAVPIPDWSTPSPSVNVTPSPSAVSLSKGGPQSQLTVLTPGAAPGDPQTQITLQNVVATFTVTCQLDLKKINFKTRNSEYNPGRFNGVVMRIREPRTTALIFASGKIVCTGSRSEPDALLASKKFARILQKIGFPVRFTSFKIQNIVATCDLRFPIKLENLNQNHGQFSNYEPELFPGLIYRMVKPRLVLLIFVNGKIVFTGGKSRQDLKESLENIYPILKSYRKN